MITSPLNHPAPADSEPEYAAELKVVMIYEDLEAAEEAKLLCHHLIARRGERAALHSRMWRFDFLMAPEHQEAAARHASNAQIIIVATHGTADLPPIVRDWFQRWLPPPGTQTRRKIIGLFSSEPTPGSELSVADGWLRRTAAEADLDYELCCAATLGEPGELTGEELTARACTVSSTLNHIMQQPTRPRSPGRS